MKNIIMSEEVIKRLTDEMNNEIALCKKKYTRESMDKIKELKNKIRLLKNQKEVVVINEQPIKFDEVPIIEINNEPKEEPKNDDYLVTRIYNYVLSYFY